MNWTKCDDLIGKCAKSSHCYIDVFPYTLYMHVKIYMQTGKYIYVIYTDIIDFLKQKFVKTVT